MFTVGTITGVEFDAASRLVDDYERQIPAFKSLRRVSLFQRLRAKPG